MWPDITQRLTWYYPQSQVSLGYLGNTWSDITHRVRHPWDALVCVPNGPRRNLYTRIFSFVLKTYLNTNTNVLVCVCASLPPKSHCPRPPKSHWRINRKAKEILSTKVPHQHGGNRSANSLALPYSVVTAQYSKHNGLCSYATKTKPSTPWAGQLSICGPSSQMQNFTSAFSGKLGTFSTLGPRHVSFHYSIWRPVVTLSHCCATGSSMTHCCVWKMTNSQPKRPSHKSKETASRKSN